MSNNKITIFIYLIILFIVLTIGKTLKNNSIEKTIFNLLIKSGIPEPLSLLIVAQAKHETAFKKGIPFTSYGYLVRNNLFGYGHVKGNPLQTDGGKHPEDNSHYAKYDNIENSILDVAAYYKRRKAIFFPITDKSDFVNALKNAGYFGDPVAVYLGGVKKFYKSNLS